MALQIQTKGYKYWWNITAHLPTDGGTTEHNFEIQFRYDPAIQKEWERSLEDYSQTGAELDYEKVISGWRGVEMDGAELKFSSKNLQNLMDIPFITKAIATAWYESLSGNKVRVKN